MNTRNAAITAVVTALAALIVAILDAAEVCQVLPPT